MNSILEYLQLQPIDPQDEASKELNQNQQDEVIDLTHDVDEQALEQGWEEIISDLHTPESTEQSQDS